MTSELAKTTTEQSLWTFERIESAAKCLAKSKIGGLNEDQAMVLMLRARADHIDPILAVDMYHLIPVQEKGSKDERGNWVQGQIIGYRTTISAQEVRSRFIQAGGKIRWLTELSNGEEQTGEFTWQNEVTKHTYKLETFRRNKVAVTAKGELKENWWKFGGAMLRARLSCDYVRSTCPHVLNGLYAQEEFDDGVDVVSSESRVVPDATPAIVGTIESAPKAPEKQHAPVQTQAAQKADDKPEPPSREEYSYVIEVLSCDPGMQSISMGKTILRRLKEANIWQPERVKLEKAIIESSYKHSMRELGNSPNEEMIRFARETLRTMESMNLWKAAQEKLGNEIASAQNRLLDAQSGNDFDPGNDPGIEPAPPEEEGSDPKAPPPATADSAKAPTEHAPILSEAQLPPKDLKADLEVSRVKQWERTFANQKRRDALEAEWARCCKIQWAHASLVILKRAYETNLTRFSDLSKTGT